MGISDQCKKQEYEDRYMITLCLMLPALIYAAATDAMSRIIKNSVPIYLMLLGAANLVFCYLTEDTFKAAALDSIAAFIIPVILFLGITIHSDHAVGGGDIKLYASLGFAAGTGSLFFFLIVSCLAAWLYGTFAHEKYAPMAVFVLLSVLLLYFICVVKIFN